jgi:hypothetical protein
VIKEIHEYLRQLAHEAWELLKKPSWTNDFVVGVMIILGIDWVLNDCVLLKTPGIEKV